jgi:hypothetical protein
MPALVWEAASCASPTTMTKEKISKGARIGNRPPRFFDVSRKDDIR